MLAKSHAELMNPSSLRIVHVTSVHRPRDVRIFEKQCRSLADSGHQVTLIATGDEVHGELRSVEQGVQLRLLPRPQGRLERVTKTMWQVYRAVRSVPADLYHFHDPELLPVAWWLQRMGYVVVYDMHENVPLDIRTKQWLPAFLRPIVAALTHQMERLVLRRMPVVFAEESYGRAYPWVNKSQVVLNMPRLESLPAPARPNRSPPHVAYIGAVAPDRGSLVILDALAELSRHGVDVGMECVGPASPASHAKELAARARSLGLQHVHFRGYQPGPIGWQMIAGCQIGLALLHPVPNFVDSYPTKMFEYMAMGMPVIVSNFPLYQQIVEQTACGLCVDPTSVGEIASAIEQLIADPAAAQQMGRRGRLAVENRYQWSEQYHKLEQFYEQLVSPPRRAP